MSFGYNQIDLDELQGVRLVKGEISPKTKDMDGKSENKTKEQKRKAQLVNFLEEDFEEFHNLIEDIIECYSVGARNELLSDVLEVPNYAACQNCHNMAKSKGGGYICKETRHERDGETVYKIIPDKNSIPGFCEDGMAWFEFPEDRISEVNDELLSVASEDNDNKEWISHNLNGILRGLFNPRDFEKYRRAAINISWLLHLDDVLQEEYHHQRAEAYLRAMDSKYETDTLPGQGGDEFENDVRDWLTSLGFPMFNRVFELEGVSANRKEMDIHTQLPWGERAIFEVFTSGAHSKKERQIIQYTELLKRAKNVDAVPILLTDGYASTGKINRGVFFDILDYDGREISTDLEIPGEFHHEEAHYDVEYLGNSNSLSYPEFEPDYEPTEDSQIAESKLMADLRGAGYNPELPVYKSGCEYGYCGPTIEIGEGDQKLILILHMNRERPWKKVDSVTERNERMSEFSDHGYGYKWLMAGPSSWARDLAKIRDAPTHVLQLFNEPQSELHVYVFDKLLRAS